MQTCDKPSLAECQMLSGAVSCMEGWQVMHVHSHAMSSLHQLAQCQWHCNTAMLFAVPQLSP